MKPSLLDRIVATLFTKKTSSRRVRRFLTGAALTTAFVVASFFAAPAQAQYGLPQFTVGASDGSTSVVGFGGKQWYVINDNTGSDPKSVRLLHKWDESSAAGAGGNFDVREFRRYTSGAYEQPYKTNPNEYGGGTLQQYLEAQAGALSAGEQAVLIERSKASMIDLDQTGQDFAAQKLWALSLAEWNDATTGVKGDAQTYPSVAEGWNDGYFWLRSPGGFDAYAFVGGSGGGGDFFSVDNSFAVRPASDLNLSSVIFTSTNDVTNGKSRAATGGDWYAYTPAQPARDIKFTFSDTINQATPNLTLKSDMKFDFTGATTGTNQYVSGLLHGPADLYARFAETTSTESGSFSTPTTISGDGVYAFDIFCEQANGVNFSDFMGRPVQFELTVSGGAATDLTLVSTDIAFGLDGGTIGLKNGSTYTQTWTLGTSVTSAINVKTGESSTISGTMTGNGGFTKTGTGILTLSSMNTYAGITEIKKGTLQAGSVKAFSDNSHFDIGTDGVLNLNDSDQSIGGLEGEGTVQLGSKKLTVNQATDSIFSGTISNAAGGTLSKNGNGGLMLAGNLAQSLNLEVTGNGYLGLQRNANYTLENKLTGTGTLLVDLNGHDLTLDQTKIGTAFTGVLNIRNSNLALNADTENVLQNVGLKLSEDASTTVTQDRTIKALTMDGGTLKFDVASITPGGVLTVTNLNTTNSGGTIQMDVNKPIVTSISTMENWYDYGNSASAKQHQLVSASSVTGDGTQLVWKDYQGNSLSTQTRTINNGTENVGSATFGYAGTVDDDGIKLGYTLTELSAMSGKTIELDSTGATGTILNAKLTGTGGFTFSGTNNVFVGNTASDYSGATTITGARTVTMRTNNAFGNTSSLALSNSAKLDMDGKSQTVADINVASGTEIVVGSLNVSSGTIAGTLSGIGTTTQTGGTLTYSGTQNTGSFIQNSGTFNSTAGATLNNATFKGMVNPTGTLNVKDNATFDGAEVDFGLLTAGNKIVVDGHADINSVTMRVDAASIIDSSSYTLTEFDTVDMSGIHVISVKNLGENRGGEYIKSNALKFDVIVGNTTLTWKGSSNTWNDNDRTNRNWSATNIDTYFKNGDSIIFADSTTNKNVTVASAITVGTMDVSAAGYTFNVDLDKGGSITADQFTNTGDAVIVATKTAETNLEKGRDNRKAFGVLIGSGADDFAATFAPTNSRIKSELFTDAHSLGFWLWLAAYAETYEKQLSLNGSRMAGLIDTLPDGNGFLAALDALTDDEAILSGLENATGEAYAASMDGTAKLQRTFNDLLIARKTARRSSCDPCAPVCGNRKSYELWGQFTGGSHDRSSIGSHRGYDLSSCGVAFGMERELGRRWFGGIAFGYDNANLKLDDRHAKDEFEAFRASLYGGYAGRNWYASGYAGYSKNWHDLKRDNYALGFSNRGKYDDDVFSTGFELGRVMKLRNGAQFIPSVGVHWIHLDNPAFTERGDTASALFVSKSHYDSVRLPIGARLNKTFTTSRGLCPWTIAWTPEVRAFYVAELADTRAGLNTAFASSLGSGSVFADSGNSGRSGGQFGTGIMAQLTTRLSVGVDYDYEVWEHYDRHNLTGNVTVRW